MPDHFGTSLNAVCLTDEYLFVVYDHHFMVATNLQSLETTEGKDTTQEDNTNRLAGRISPTLSTYKRRTARSLWRQWHKTDAASMLCIAQP